jgi:hypothetical protein
MSIKFDQFFMEDLGRATVAPNPHHHPHKSIQETSIPIPIRRFGHSSIEKVHNVGSAPFFPFPILFAPTRMSPGRSSIASLSAVYMATNCFFSPLLFIRE